MAKNHILFYFASHLGCKGSTAAGEFAYSETDVDTSIGASHDKSACLGNSAGYLRSFSIGPYVAQE